MSRTVWKVIEIVVALAALLAIVFYVMEALKW